jgi:hypothetical protein
MSTSIAPIFTRLEVVMAYMSGVALACRTSEAVQETFESTMTYMAVTQVANALSAGV